LVHPIPPAHNVFAYVFEGEGVFGEGESARTLGNHMLVVFGAGDAVAVNGGEKGVRFLLISGKPLKEPVAWRGPIVMNTQEELQLAWRELREGTFIKHAK